MSPWACRGKTFRGDAGNDFLEHGVDVFTHHLHDEMFTDNRSALVVLFGDRRQFGIGETTVDLGEELPHTTTSNNGNPVFPGIGRSGCGRPGQNFPSIDHESPFMVSRYKSRSTKPTLTKIRRCTAFVNRKRLR